MNAPARPIIVLVVDDDPGDVLLIQEALELTGHTQTVHVASDGQEAMAFLGRAGTHGDAPRPDVILLDLNMPRKNGRQVLAEIKEQPHLSTIPILVFTTSRDPEDVRTSYALHANAYVTKPINLDDFTTAVQRIADFFTQVVTLPSETTGPAPVLS